MTTWRKSLWRLSAWWRTRSRWWGKMRALKTLNSCCSCALKWGCYDFIYYYWSSFEAIESSRVWKCLCVMLLKKNQFARKSFKQRAKSTCWNGTISIHFIAKYLLINTQYRLILVTDLWKSASDSASCFLFDFLSNPYTLLVCFFSHVGLLSFLMCVSLFYIMWRSNIVQPINEK